MNTDKESLAKRSAEMGYFIYFGAKRHFATYEIVETIPAYFGIITTGLGVLLLAYPSQDWERPISVATIILGFAIWHLNSYHDKDKYSEVGKELTKNYYEARSIYEKAKSQQAVDLQKLEEDLKKITDNLQHISIYKQVWGSGVFAHYKVFGESSTDWFIKELKLTFWKDMVPASTKALALVIILGIAMLLGCNQISALLSSCFIRS